MGLFDNIFKKKPKKTVKNRKVEAFRYRSAYSSNERKKAEVDHVHTHHYSRQRERTALIDEARALEDNTSLIKYAVNEKTRYCVPIDWIPSIKSSRKKKAIKKYLDNAFKYCDLTGRKSFYKICSIVKLRQTIDGDCGVYTLNAPKNSKLITGEDDNFLKLQIIDAKRIGNKNDVKRLNDENNIEGVEIDKNLKPTKFHIYKTNKNSILEYDFAVDSNNFFLVFNSFKCGQYRGFSELTQAIDDVKDAYEILLGEKMVVKYSGKLLAIKKTETGELDEDQGFPIPQENEFCSTVKPCGLVDCENCNPKTHTENHGDFHVLATGLREEIKQFTNERPNATFNGFLLHLEKSVARSLNVPALWFGIADRIQGTDLRLRLRQFENSIKEERRWLESEFYTPLLIKIIAHGIKSGLLQGVTLEEAIAGRWNYPSDPTVDEGRTSGRLSEEMKSGVLTRSEFVSSQGKDPDDHENAMEQQTVDLINRAKRIGKKTGVNFETAFNILKINDGNLSESTDINSNSNE